MKVLVDTSVSSLALRRKHAPGDDHVRSTLASLIEDGRVAMIGPIRQEVLSAVKESTDFERLREHLRAFPDAEITTDDYERAASFFDLCRANGIQGSNTDFLICAVAARSRFSIYTTDKDFAHFAKVVPIELHAVPA